MGSLGTIAGATTLAQAIHKIWAANAALHAAVPDERFLTGRMPPSEEMPYVRLELDGSGNVQRTSSTLYQKQGVVFHVWTDDFDAGEALVPLIRSAFESQEFDWTTGGVLDLRQDGTADTNQTNIPEIKAWETTVRFTANTWEQRQDRAGSSSSGP